MKDFIMIKTITAYTHEIDDAEQAVSDLLKQLENKLLKNSVGLVTCFADFIDSEVVKELAEQVSFPIVGKTTIGNMTAAEKSNMMLTLTVITSDDVEFVAGLTDPIPGEDETPFRKAYEKANQDRKEKPALMISFAPLMMNVGGDFFVNTLNRISEGVPNFGTITVDHNSDYHAAQVIYGGEAYRDRLAFVLAYGNITPKFYVASISEEKLYRNKGVVTASQGNQLQTVDGVPVIDYLESIGMQKNEDGTITGVNSFPFVVDFGDGSKPIVRVLFAITPEGYAVCGGDIPVGTKLSVGSIDADEVLNTSEKALNEVQEKSSINGMIMFSCVGRYFALEFDSTKEMDLIQEKTGEIPFVFAYSGGEICPLYDRDGNTVNRFHNDTLVICTF